MATTEELIKQIKKNRELKVAVGIEGNKDIQLQLPELVRDRLRELQRQDELVRDKLLAIKVAYEKRSLEETKKFFSRLYGPKSPPGEVSDAELRRYDAHYPADLQKRDFCLASDICRYHQLTVEPESVIRRLRRLRKKTKNPL